MKLPTLNISPGLKVVRILRQRARRVLVENPRKVIEALIRAAQLERMKSGSTSFRQAERPQRTSARELRLNQGEEQEEDRSAIGETVRSQQDANQGARLKWAQLQQASDETLMRQLVLGNDDALAVIIDRYQRLIFSVAWRFLKDEEEAEDVVKVVFLDVFRKTKILDPSSKCLKLWLLQSAYTRSINRRYHLRQGKP